MSFETVTFIFYFLVSPFFDYFSLWSRLSFIWYVLWFLVILLIYALLIILNVAITTLHERKVLGRTQLREGPQLVGFFGLLQPFADAFKLLFKEVITPALSNKVLHLGAPVIVFLISILCWVIMPLGSKAVFLNSHLGILLLLALSSINVYGILISGWASNSRYSFLGSLRAAAQMISYEVSLGVILLHVIVITRSFNLAVIVEWQERLGWFLLPLFPSFILFFISALAETNRSPFDFPEAESELVSGFNTEYSSITFALFFLGEYANIILLSNLMVILFLGGWNAPVSFLSFLPAEFWYFLKYFLVLTPFMVIRSTLPRYRYDQLMRLGWKVYVPLSIIFLILGTIVHFIIF